MVKNQMLAKAIKHWAYIAPLASYPKNDKQFDDLVSHLDSLLEIVGQDEKHPAMGLVDFVSYLIAAYEVKQDQNVMGHGIDALKFLMTSHHLQQSDLTDIASQGVISEILNGKRALNLRQIKLLAERFHVDPSTFID